MVLNSTRKKGQMLPIWLVVFNVVRYGSSYETSAPMDQSQPNLFCAEPRCYLMFTKAESCCDLFKGGLNSHL